MGTLEFFPEEGKYHMDGHRACGRCMTPAETAKAGGRCPVCGRKVTVGVLHRVEELADREEGYVRPGAPGFQSLVPLEEVIAASDGVAAAGVKARAKYERMLRSLGPEFTILRETRSAKWTLAAVLIPAGIGLALCILIHCMFTLTG